jgi:sugar phosphate isomerase/epimerase
MLLSRRDFGRSLLAAAVTGQAVVAANTPQRLAVSTWSFHNYFVKTRYGSPKFQLEEWTLEDVIRRAKDRLGIRAFELSSAHLASMEASYLDQLRAFAQKENCQFIHLSDNIKGVNLARADRAQRDADLKTFEQLIGVAQRLGIPSMRVNTGTPESKDWDISTTIEQYRHLAGYGKERGVEIVIENHFGISADPKNVAQIIEAVGNNISSCPDFGLFRTDAERWPGLDIMFKHCRRLVSAKFHGFEDDGKPRDFDLRRCYRVMKAAKCPGWVSLEYEGPLEPLPQLERMARLARSWLSED